MDSWNISLRTKSIFHLYISMQRQIKSPPPPERTQCISRHSFGFSVRRAVCLRTWRPARQQRSVPIQAFSKACILSQWSRRHGMDGSPRVYNLKLLPHRCHGRHLLMTMTMKNSHRCCPHCLKIPFSFLPILNWGCDFLISDSQIFLFSYPRAL